MGDEELLKRLASIEMFMGSPENNNARSADAQAKLDWYRQYCVSMMSVLTVLCCHLRALDINKQDDNFMETLERLAVRWNANESNVRPVQIILNALQDVSDCKRETEYRLTLSRGQQSTQSN